MKMINWQNKRVIIIGAARQGLALARYLARHGAQVVINDRRTPDQLQAEMKQLPSSAVEWITGGHPLSIMEPRPDLLCISGGIPLNNPLVEYALQNGIPLSNEAPARLLVLASERTLRREIETILAQ